MRLRSYYGALAVLPTMLVAQTRPAVDSQRLGRSLRALELVQGFQMANSPELSSAINALLSDDGAHMHMAPRRAVAPGDSARAATIVSSARAALGKYADPALAEREGYIKFMPWLEDQSIYHYNNVGNVLATLGTFDATKPVSLLYKKDASGKMQLVGAMYSAVPTATPQDLDARLPTSVAHWHEHVDFCGPRLDAVRAGTQTVDGPSTAKWLTITTRDACDAAGGQFVSRIFGWMAHVYLFAGDDPNVIWGEEHGSMDVHAHPPPT